LNAGHEYLVELMSNGFSIDEASACIGFHIGIGRNYLYEIAKIRAMRSLWSKIIHAYTPAHTCSHNCAMTAVIGCMNKSLLDPHTNLLRQTTEVLSAMCGGVEQIVVIPHDLYSDQGMSSISQRMAINIPLVLREESYLDKVIDPLGGSYSLEQLTTKIGEKAWTLFQSLEKSGGLFNDTARSNFKQEIIAKRDQREKAFVDGSITLIGINTFPNPEKIESKWRELPAYFGIDALNYERISKTVSA
jgi:methylmalonyl-CoA mutase